MADPRFFLRRGPVDLAQLVAVTGAVPQGDGGPFADVAPLDSAEPDCVSFLESRRFADVAAATRAGACFVRAEDASALPPATLALVVAEPQRAFVKLGALLYPDELPSIPQAPGPAAIHAGAHVDPSARIGAGCRIAAGAVVEAGAELGVGCVVAANAVVGRGVRLGDGSRIGAGATISHAIVGARVIVHPGARIGQDGFGFVMGAVHDKVPQLGRVILEDDVEIGANSAVDRGSGGDTVIGRGSKIDNLVQIAHNVRVGQGCIVTGQCGIAGSSTVGPYSVLGAGTGIKDHVTIGPKTLLAARSAVAHDLPGSGAYGGAPAVPVGEWRRQVVALRLLGRRGRKETST